MTPPGTSGRQTGSCPRSLLGGRLQAGNTPELSVERSMSGTEIRWYASAARLAGTETWHRARPGCGGWVSAPRNGPSRMGNSVQWQVVVAGDLPDHTVQPLILPQAQVIRVQILHVDAMLLRQVDLGPQLGVDLGESRLASKSCFGSVQKRRPRLPGIVLCPTAARAASGILSTRRPNIGGRRCTTPGSCGRVPLPLRTRA